MSPALAYLEALEAWHEAYLEEGGDVGEPPGAPRGLYLRDVALRERHLSNAHLPSAVLIDVDLGGTDLMRASFPRRR